MTQTGSGGTQVEQDGLGDWRLQAATRLTADLPAAYPGGPSHKVGSPVYLVTSTEMAGHPNLSFRTPSATALALNSAFRSSERAAVLWHQIAFDATKTPHRSGTSVRLLDMPLLFDYFEECLAAASASFQAVEAFANETIGRYLKGTFTIQRQKGPEVLDADAIQRTVSTDEKIATVIPALLNKPTPKGRVEWPHYKELKGVRDASVHFKSADQYPVGGKTDKHSLYYRLLNNNPKRFPRTALALIWKLHVDAEAPRWLIHLADKYGTTVC
jgi:hypothetical protein